MTQAHDELLATIHSVLADDDFASGFGHCAKRCGAEADEQCPTRLMRLSAIEDFRDGCLEAMAEHQWQKMERQAEEAGFFVNNMEEEER